MTKRSRPPPPPFAYAAILFLGATLGPFLLSLDDDGAISSYADFASRRNLGDDGTALYSLKDIERYSNLQDPSDIDRSIEERARANVDDEGRCSRLFLYLPDPFADHGHGSQINTYIMGATVSSYVDRAMVLVEPPNEGSRYAGGSQFGCPVDAFRETVRKQSPAARNKAGKGGNYEWDVRGDFPRGFSRLVRHPAWLSRGCDVPCQGTHSYADWLKLFRGDLENEVTCQNADGSTANVVVTGGSGLRKHFREHEGDMAMRDRRPSPAVAERWAANLGASPEEAETFSNIQEPRQVWDYVLGLMNRAGFLEFQPWIARDVALFLKSFDFPFGEKGGEYDAIHVRRGDKLAVEARREVVAYWRGQGHEDMDNLPTDYVPFAHYLGQWDGPETCSRDEDGNPQLMKHDVYVATDDPKVVHQEIAALPNHVDENTVVWNDCHQLTFHFNPTDDSAFHLNGDGQEGFKEEGPEGGAGGGDSCFGRYHRNVASIADMMILSKARTFVGEFNSNWGRVIRTMRVRLNAPQVQGGGEGETRDASVARMARNVDGLTRTLDTRVAWGPTKERAPGY